MVAGDLCLLIDVGLWYYLFFIVSIFFFFSFIFFFLPVDVTCPLSPYRYMRGICASCLAFFLLTCRLISAGFGK